MSLISLPRALEILSQDEIVAIPTETVYGLAGRIDSPTALKKIFTVKKRPYFDPLIVHVHSIEDAKRLCLEWPEVYDILAKEFWPGPLTLVAKKNSRVHDLISSGLDTVAIRCPLHPLAQQILFSLKTPFAAPSANRFGKTSPTRWTHVETEFNGEIPIVDGGPCQVGLESTVVQWDFKNKTQLSILRPGVITATLLQKALLKHQIKVKIEKNTSHRSPGFLLQHYQPKWPLVIINKYNLIEKDKASILNQLNTHLPKPHFLSSKIDWIELELDHQPQIAARELYHQLHNLSSGKKAILYFLTKGRWQSPEWEGLVDRLSRAASLQYFEEEPQ